MTYNQGVFNGSTPITSIVSISADDNANTLSGAATPLSVTVTPLAPTVALSGPTTANEGDTKLYTFAVTGQDTLDSLTISAATATGGTITNYQWDSPWTRVVST